MLEVGKRLFVGIKISSELQNELNSPGIRSSADHTWS